MLKSLKPGYKKLQQKTGLPVLGTIPMTNFDIPDEDSIGNSSKNLTWNATNLKRLDKEINKITKVVKSSLNIRNSGETFEMILESIAIIGFAIIIDLSFWRSTKSLSSYSYGLEI